MNEQKTTIQQAVLRTEIEQLTKIEAEIDRLQRRREAIRNNLRTIILTNHLATSTNPTTTTTTTTTTTQTQTQTQTLELAVPSAGVTLRLTTSITKRIDTQRLKADLPDIAAKYTKLALREQLTVKTGLPNPAIPQPAEEVK
jgi:hypothetical protein